MRSDLFLRKVEGGSMDRSQASLLLTSQTRARRVLVTTNGMAGTATTGLRGDGSTNTVMAWARAWRHLVRRQDGQTLAPSRTSAVPSDTYELEELPCEANRATSSSGARVHRATP